MKHLIRKQLISLQLDAGQNSFLIQQQARDFYYQQITPALETLFDELSLENEIIYIEKLEIDLGDLGWKNDRFTLDKDAIYRILIQSFGKSISKSAISLNVQEQVSYRTPEENTFQQWLYYLEKGVLPWQVHTTDAKWLHQVLHQLAIDHVSIEKTKRMMVTDPRFLTRLVREHHEKFLQHLAEVITAKRQPGLIEKVREVRKQFSEFPGETQFSEKEIWEQVLKQYAEGKSSIDFPEILPVEKKILPVSTSHHDNKILQEGLYCHYAGLVLLHPFFRHLFNHLQLLEDGVFRSAASLEKAVLLLYFIATGKTEAKDYELVVPKIFCGMPLHEVIREESFFLTEIERQEALNMMHAAIEQWEIIRDTSVEGLRESFLAREGKILTKDSGIEFRIESRGIDVLLDQLPWNLSLVKFSWLDKLIYVEWR